MRGCDSPIDHYTESSDGCVSSASQGVRKVRLMRGKIAGRHGQALVEFALILPLFLLLVVGIIQFGIGLNYWLDLTHTANQGARYATVNLAPVCTGSPTSPCTVNGVSNKTFAEFLKNELSSGPLKTGGTTSIPSPGATVCYYYTDLDSNPGATPGDPITVKISTTYRWLPFLKLADVTLVGKATMRLEQKPVSFNPGTTAC